MALKKSELYSSLWSSCDELRGGMDASQYKDYVLVLLFIKHVSDKYAGQTYAPITIPAGASFKDMVARCRWAKRAMYRFRISRLASDLWQCVPYCVKRSAAEVRHGVVIVERRTAITDL